MKTTLFLTMCLATSIGFAQNSKKHVIHFSSNSYIISPAEADKLSNFISKYGNTELESIELSGHTDSEASDAYNVNLSLNRCEEVSRFMRNKLNVQAKTNINSFGEQNPVASNASKLGKANNRRVEIVLYYKSRATQKDEFSPTSEDYYYDGWEKEGQTFKIDPNVTNTLKGNEGTLIIIPKEAICNSKNLTSVEITLKEYLTMSDILMAQLTTTSDDKIIETNGMVEIRAYNDTDRLKLCKEIAVLFPIEKNKSANGFMGFDGEHDPRTGFVNWNPNGVTTPNELNTDLFNSDGSFSGTTSWTNCMQGEIPIRCSKNCRSNVLQNQGKQTYRQLYKSDEVVKRLRKRYWFKNTVSSPTYFNKYLKIKSKMNDTMSAAGLLPCRTRFANTVALKKYLKSLEKGGEIDLDLADMSVNYVITQSSNFGLINCDRFTNYPDVQNVDYSVGDASGAISSRIIFHKQKSILPGYKTTNNKVAFSRVPIGEMVTLLVIKFFKDKIFIASPKYKLGQTPNLSFEVVKKENLESKIKQIIGH